MVENGHHHFAAREAPALAWPCCAGTQVADKDGRGVRGSWFVSGLYKKINRAVHSLAI